MFLFWLLPSTSRGDSPDKQLIPTRLLGRDALLPDWHGLVPGTVAGVALGNGFADDGGGACAGGAASGVCVEPHGVIGRSISDGWTARFVLQKNFTWRLCLGTPTGGPPAWLTQNIGTRQPGGQQFREWRKEKYKTLDSLNDHWATAYWSQTHDKTRVQRLLTVRVTGSQCSRLRALRDDSDPLLLDNSRSVQERVRCEL